MKFRLKFAFLLAFILFFSAFPLWAQQSFEQDHPQHNVLQKIDRAFQQGKLTLDQKVLYKFYAVKKPQKLPAQYQSQDSLPVKCGTPAIIDFQTNKTKLSLSVVQEIESMQGSTMLAAETYQSSSGKFLIHYETTGDNAVPSEDINPQNGIPDYIDQVAAAADSSYSHEVLTLGYSNPISAGQTYDIEVLDLSFYGQTYVTGGTTAIQIENDFVGFPPNTDPEGDAIGAVKVTIAHELKHAIQYAATQWSGETDLWAEMDATLMEEVVYDNVNDYYNYLEAFDSIFNSPASSFYPGTYYHVSWAIFFEEKYGADFWPGVWDIIVADPNISMTDAMSEQLGGIDTFQQAYMESQLWHFASGPLNSSPNFGFEEREFYPNPNINYHLMGSDLLTIPLDSPDSLQAFSANYIEVQPLPFSGYAAIALSDISTETGIGIIGYLNDGSTETVTLHAEVEQDLLDYQTPWQWEDLAKIGLVIGNSSTNEPTGYELIIRAADPQLVSLEQNYPNPFIDKTTIWFSLPERKHVILEVFDVLGRKVSTLIDDIMPQGVHPELYNPDNLASGIYFYRLTVDGEVRTKQMTFIK